MDIDSLNFEKYLPFILSSIQGAEFISFDAEFTGIHADENQYIHKYDSFEDVYQKTKHTCINFKLLQFGLCTFRWDNVIKKYIARPFNFYIYKKKSRSQNNVHIVSNDAMAFLADQAMNFNQVFSRGINYHRIKEGPPVMIIQNHYQNKATKNGTFFSAESESTRKVLLESVRKFVFEVQNEKELLLDCHTPFLALYMNNKTLTSHFGVSLSLQRQTVPNSPNLVKFVKPKGFKVPRLGEEEGIRQGLGNDLNKGYGRIKIIGGDNHEINMIKSKNESLDTNQN